MTQERDRGEVMPGALCACGCGKPWAKWCRACNLVYTAEHVDPGFHRCPPFERLVPTPAAVKSEESPKKRRRRAVKQ